MSTPLMKQYNEIKKDYMDSILFFRLGDFYEMFFEDAKIASKVLGLTLTSRNREKDMEVPLAGIPFHSSRGYIAKLVNAGYKVAICEQVEDPKTAKGIVKREVIKVISAGTMLDVDEIDSKSNNYLLSVSSNNNMYGISYLDITTGEFKVLETDEDNLISEIYKIEPKEIVLTKELNEKLKVFFEKINVRISIIEKVINPYEFLKNYFNLLTLESFNLSEKSISLESAANILDYVLSMQFNNDLTITKIEFINKSEFTSLSSASIKNLDLLKNQKDNQVMGSLLWVIDKCKSSIGSRKLKSLIQNPLTNLKEINEKYDDVEFLIDNILIREDIKVLLNSIYDLERLLGKIIFSNENAKDLISLKKTILASIEISKLWPEKFKEIDIELLFKIYNKIDYTLKEDAPFSVREGNMINDGINEELDELRNIMNHGSNILLEIEAREKEKTGIKNLKIKYNNVFGYFIEVSKSNISMVPENYVRKQTISNAERFITEEIKSYEDKIINSKSKIEILEYNLLKELSGYIKEFKSLFINLSSVIANIDILCSFASIAVENGYVRPTFNNDDIFEIKEARHPIVEKLIKENTFVKNNIFFDKNERFLILTGPNMSGKSTYMKQIALICIMAQIGCFVPATCANLNIVDKILTRIGASDDILSGQSTFMVEMSEVANIINNATKDSLIILDEVGRGTSTFDGLSIASSISKYIAENINAKTIFATHYHELTELEKNTKNVVNYRIEVEEKDGKVSFLRTIVKGGADKSYGIEVAKLAGLPRSIIKEANKILKSLEKERENSYQLSLFENLEYENYDRLEELENTIDELNKKIDKIRQMDINNMTPLEALNNLVKLKEEIK